MSGQRVLIVDDEENLCRVLGREVATMGYRARLAADGTEALSFLEEEDIAVVLLDLRLPGRGGLEILAEIKARWRRVEVIVLTGHGSIETAIKAMRAGAYHYLQKPCHLDELEALLDKAVERQTLVLHAEALAAGQSPCPIEWGGSEALGRVRGDLMKVAPTDASVLILGESGTGKELIAREIHAQSACSNGRFVVVNCGAIPASLAESTLFGHEKGAFTGALERKLGLVEIAHEGSLFLDEVGELPLDVQVKLLRFLQSGELVRVGATDVQMVNARLLSATNVDIDEAVRQGEFREDLRYRLEVIRLELPPLRERADDIPALVQRFLDELAAKGRPRRIISPDGLARLARHSWPGNVRELRHVVERVSILSEEEVIGEEEVSRRLGRTRGNETSGGLMPIREMERRMIVLALRRFHGDKPQAAKTLGIALKTLYNKLKAYEIDVESAVRDSQA